jgi:hypothetical protein
MVRREHAPRRYSRIKRRCHAGGKKSAARGAYDRRAGPALGRETRNDPVLRAHRHACRSASNGERTPHLWLRRPENVVVPAARTGGRVQAHAGSNASQGEESWRDFLPRGAGDDLGPSLQRFLLQRSVFYQNTSEREYSSSWPKYVSRARQVACAAQNFAEQGEVETSRSSADMYVRLAFRRCCCVSGMRTLHGKSMKTPFANGQTVPQAQRQTSWLASAALMFGDPHRALNFATKLCPEGGRCGPCETVWSVQ